MDFPAIGFTEIQCLRIARPSESNADFRSRKRKCVAYTDDLVDAVLTGLESASTFAHKFCTSNRHTETIMPPSSSNAVLLN